MFNLQLYKMGNKLLLLVFIFMFFTACKKNDAVADKPIPVKPALVASSFTLGNLELVIRDTFTLVFNKSVQLKYIKFKLDYCLPELKTTISNDGKTIKFANFLCGKLGAEYPFEYSVKDTDGNTLTDSITFWGYTRKIVTAGRPADYFITPDNKYCWTVTQQPNTISCYGLIDTGYKVVYNLNFIPGGLRFNEYNNKFYIFPKIDDFINRGKIFVLNPTNGIIEKIIPLDPFPFPSIYAYDMAFGINGYGIVLFSNEYSITSWKIIDSRLNDTIYKHPIIAAGNYPTSFVWFVRVYTDHTKSKIIALAKNGSRLGILDCITQNLTEFEHPLSAQYNTSFIAVHKFKNDIFYTNPPYTQFITSNGTLTGSMTFLNSRNNAEADFSYRPNEDNYIYYMDNQVFGVVNYNTGKVLMSTKFDYDLRLIKSTTDGKYLLAAGEGYIKLFDLNMFYKYL